MPVSQRDKTYLWTCAPSEDSDQSAYSSSLIRIFTEHILDSHGCNVSSCGQQTLIILRECSYLSKGMFSYVMAHIILQEIHCFVQRQSNSTLKRTARSLHRMVTAAMQWCHTKSLGVTGRMCATIVVVILCMWAVLTTMIIYTICWTPSSIMLYG